MATKWFKNLLSSNEKPKLTKAEQAAAKEQAMKCRKFGGLTVRFNPEITECDKAGVKFILNDDTNPIPFETPFFIGRMVVRVKNAENAPETTYWKGKARKFSIQVQGRFKKRLCSNNVRSGSYFKKKIITPWGASIPMKILCSIDPSLRHDVFNEKKPWVASPLICAVEQCTIRNTTGDKSNRGLGPWNFGGEKRVNEDSHLFLPKAIRATTPKMGFKQRCHYFAKEELRKNTYWEPGLIYNFDFLSSRVDFNKFNCVIGPFKKGMAPYMNKQPFDFRAAVYDAETNSKVIGHLFGIEFMLDSMFDGEVATDEKSAPVGADQMEVLDLDSDKRAAEYDRRLDLSPRAGSTKAPAPAAPALPAASLGAAAAAASSVDAESAPAAASE